MTVFLSRRRLAALALILIVLAGGCAQRRLCAPAELLNPAQYVDVNAAPGTHNPVQRKVFDALTSELRQEARDGPNRAAGRKLNVLALSGGGSNGAFSAGVLNGWTATGTRPSFDTVTGISTGALIATFAFLGPAYDGHVRRMYTEVSSDDIYQRRPKLAVLWSDSAASSAPLKRLVDSQIDRRVFCEVARAHAQGRRLFIGTTNLDTGRLVIWDMGAIASSGRPGAIKLYREIILASASVPGFFPPVPIEVTVNGRKYTELHVDGATTSEVFLHASMLNLDPDTIRPDEPPLAGSRVYIIIAGKPFPEPRCAKPRAIDIAGNALSALTSAQTRSDLIRIYTLSLLTGMEFRMAAMPQDFPTHGSSLSFDPPEMKRLYEHGYRLACSGKAWRDTPPVVEPAEQSVPRAGTEFLTAGR
ncbi:MAG: patatin-like phospholipase family protein [Planctomycetes bacterium]|nr:patatin-like phospholipase family protein [Planctomycetota bacterium]